MTEKLWSTYVTQEEAVIVFVFLIGSAQPLINEGMQPEGRRGKSLGYSAVHSRIITYTTLHWLNI